MHVLRAKGLEAIALDTVSSGQRELVLGAHSFETVLAERAKVVECARRVTGTTIPTWAWHRSR